MTDIAIIKLGALGDVVRTTALLRPLHRVYPGVRLWWFTRESAVPLLERNPWIHRIMTLEKFRLSDLGPLVFDMVLGLDDDPEACQLSRDLPARSHFGAFTTSRQQWVYTPSSGAWFDMGLLNRDSDGSLSTANSLKQTNQKSHPKIFLEMLHLQGGPPEEYEPVIIPSPYTSLLAREWTRTLKATGRKIIGLNTGGGMRWAGKQIPESTARRLILALTHHFDHTLLLLGGEHESERNRQFSPLSPGRVLVASTEKSLDELVTAINACDLIITSDSLALHIANALKKPVIVCVGPTSTAELELYGRGYLWKPKEACGCFYQPACQRTRSCLETLSVMEVIPWVKEALREQLDPVRAQHTGSVR